MPNLSSRKCDARNFYRSIASEDSAALHRIPARSAVEVETRVDTGLPKKYYMSMNATTIKIENPLLNEIVKITPEKKSISAFVREVLENEVQRQKMIQAAERYSEFLASNPEEREWMGDWESADLARSPRPASRKRKKI